MISHLRVIQALSSLGLVLGGIVPLESDGPILQQYDLGEKDGIISTITLWVKYLVNFLVIPILMAAYSYGWENYTSDDTANLSGSLAARQCGVERVQCSTANLASVVECTDLIRDIGTSGISIPPSPRSICLSRSGSRCCISWSRPVSKAIEADLRNAADRVVRQCVRPDGTMSGLTRNTQIGTTCASQCLSNRPDGCS